VSSHGALGDFLRARRDLLGPAQAGLENDGHRRVPGLRRDEVADLAGISTDYLVRLEQGRDQHPSPQVVDALARALQLDPHAHAHLQDLAATAHEPPRLSETVPETIRDLVDQWASTPAIVQNSLSEVLAANQLARLINPLFEPGRQPLREMFLADTVKQIYPQDFDRITRAAVAELREATGRAGDSPELRDLIAELSEGSPLFRRLWASQTVGRRPPRGTSAIRHPELGLVRLNFEKFSIPETDLTLVVYHADPGSPAAEAIQTLAPKRRNGVAHQGGS
jgi:transcriptional regulator with XRE-family HTH domain